MTLLEVGPGVYVVKKKDLADDEEFIRDFPEEEEGGFPSLLHVCMRTEDAAMISLHSSPDAADAYLLHTGIIYWDYSGTYRCSRCQEEFNTPQDLACIWYDGIGTGIEGTA